MTASQLTAQPYVFISYASSDRERAQRIVSTLQAADITCWMDQHGIEGGANWGLRITEAIEGCVGLVLLSSAASLASRNVRQEVAIAWKFNKPYLPLLLDQTPIPNDITYWLIASQWIEVLDLPTDRWLPKVTAAIDGWLRTATSPTTDERAPATPTPVVSSSPTSSLPDPPSSFIGREREMAEVAALLADHRLVTLTGPGGIGKTRIALAVAQRLAADFPDGADFVDLAPLHDPSLVLPTIASALGMRDTDVTLGDALISVLRQRRVLLVLDNFEQVIEGASEIAVVVRACPSLRVLATSREALRLSGEAVYPVEPLPLPRRERAPSVEALAANPTVALFVARAHSVKPSFELTAENAEMVAAICQRLDGLPLAVELAAARIRALSPQMLLERLSDPLHFLTGGARDLPARQQTVRTTIAWSVDLLAPEEHRLFRRLFVFVDGWTLEAAERVASGAGDLGVDVLDGLTSLVDKSLVREGELADGGLRYTMLPTIGEYAAGQAALAGEEDAIRARHAAYILDLLHRAYPATRVYDDDWLDRLEQEHDNIRAVLTWARNTDNAKLGIEVAGCMSWFWSAGYYLKEGAGWVEYFLQRYPEEDRLRVRALCAWGQLTVSRGDAATAQVAAAEARQLATRWADNELLAEILGFEAVASFYQAGREMNDAVHAKIVEAAAFAEEHHVDWLAVQCLMNVAVSDSVGRRYDLAEAAYTRCALIAAQKGWTAIQAMALDNLGVIAKKRGQPDQAVAYLRQALRLMSSGRFRQFALHALDELAAVLVATTSVTAGVRLLAVTDRENRLIGDHFNADPAMVQTALTSAHQQLSPDEFDREWQLGSQLSLPEAIAYALAATEP